MKRESLTMMVVGAISVFYGTNHYMETHHFDLMSVVMSTLSVIYFVSLAIEKRVK